MQSSLVTLSRAAFEFLSLSVGRRLTWRKCFAVSRLKPSQGMSHIGNKADLSPCPLMTGRAIRTSKRPGNDASSTASNVPGFSFWIFARSDLSRGC